ncbi:MAG: hypothetical protein KAX77_02600, partial [Xanthomonadales bacterium]|nr:hypothetical protein [Xanthomonadales bacterium]
MSNLTKCLKKAGRAIDPADADAIRAAFESYRADGMDPDQAAIEAVADAYDDAVAELNQVADAARAQGIAVEVDAKPMERPEPPQEPDLPTLTAEQADAAFSPYGTLFDQPQAKVRAEDKVKQYVAGKGWMTPEQAKAEIQRWIDNAVAQGADGEVMRRNSQRIVLSLFDKTGQWAEPWAEAGYTIYTFDIQNDPIEDVMAFSTEYFFDNFGAFDGNDVYAVLAACPCTDFAVSGARHFAAKDADGRTQASIHLVEQTMATIEFFKPAVWAIENPVGRIEKLVGLPPWRLSFNPNHYGHPYTKKTLLWGRFNADLPVAPVEPTEGSKMHSQYGGKSQATKNARSETPVGFAYAFFQANNAEDNRVLANVNQWSMLDATAVTAAVDAGMSDAEIKDLVEEFVYQELDYDGANDALRAQVATRTGQAENGGAATQENTDERAPQTPPVDLGGPGALEGAPAERVPSPAGGRAPRKRAPRGSRGDVGRDGDAQGAGVRPPAGVGNGTGELFVSPGGTEGTGPQVGLNTPPPQFTPSDFTIDDDLALGEGGAKTKYRRNVDAIRLLKQLDAEGRPATPDEQRTLALYVGWGGLSQAFDPDQKDWTREHAELNDLLTPEEYATAKRSTQYAHYTSREIITAMYEGVRRLGFTGGKVLEAGGGVGNFIGLMPHDLRSAGRFTLVEREKIAAGIAKYLYP